LCGFASGNAVAAACEDTIIAAVFEDSKQDAPAYLADKKLGAPTGGLETAWTRVQALVDAADAKSDVKLWPGGCLDWRSLRDRFFQIMQNFTKEARCLSTWVEKFCVFTLTCFCERAEYNCRSMSVSPWSALIV